MVEHRWFLQSSNRAKGRYYQAIYGHGRTRVRVVTLGYLADEVAERALANLQIGGEKVVGTPRAIVVDGHEVVVGYDDDQLRAFAMGTSERVVEGLEARVRAQQAAALVAAGNYKDLPLRDYVHTVWTPVRRREAAEGTLKREAWMWDKILPVLGHVALGRIDGMRIDQFLNSKETWSGRTRAIALNTIRNALKYAVECGILEELPRTRRVKDSTKRVSGRPVALLPEEVERILAEAASDAHRALYCYALATGARKTEASSLAWEDIDWEANTAHVRGTKTAQADRVIPLPPMARRALEALWKQLGEPKVGPCFVYKGKAIGDWKKGFRQAAKRAGIERRVYPTLARHTFCTLAAMNGVPKSATKEMMGHSSRSVMVDVAYDNPHPQMVADAMAAFDPLAKSGSGKRKTKRG